MNFILFNIDGLLPPADCPDKITLANFDGLQRTIRIIKTETVFGVVIDGVYLSLASGKDSFKRGDYALARVDGKIRLGINENLY